MKADDLKKLSMAVTVVVAIGGAVGGVYNFAYNSGYKVGSAEAKNSFILNILNISADCDKRVEELREKLFDCKSRCP